MIKHILAKYTSPGTQKSLVDNYRFLRREFGWFFNPKSWISVNRIKLYRDIHQRKRCFILGNGPSLKNTDFSLLKNEITFGLNRIYMLYEHMGFPTTYYVAVNHLVLEQCAEEIIEAVPSPKFIDWGARHFLPFLSDTMFLKNYPLEPRFFSNIAQGVWQGTTVTYVAMQIAFYMGFDQVILLGVDHSFSSKGKPHSVVVTEEKDLNHFDEQYFGKGFRWQLPDLDGSELAYRIAKYQFERWGREIIDATENGNLSVYRKVELNSLF